jgi:hypothetical protein
MGVIIAQVASMTHLAGGRGSQLGLEGALTKCYTSGEMSDDLVIFVRCNSQTEKRAFASAAEDRGMPLSRFAIEAMAEKAGVTLDYKSCLHCPKPISRSNRSGFCRKCLRTIGLHNLKRLHPR